MADDEPIFSGGIKPWPDTGRDAPEESNEGTEYNASEDAQNRIISDGQDLLSYSQDVNLKLTEYLKDVKPVIEENHM